VRRVVVDANVFVSGIIRSSGFPFKILNAWEKNLFLLVTSLPMVDEVERVLKYPKIQKKYAVDDNTIREIIGSLLKYSVLVTDLPDVKEIADDPADDKVLATAVMGRAEAIVTGDSHLLRLSRYRDIQIVTPRTLSTMMEL
jgi:putative PIN family toxin of toxin-antitoxin system